MGFGKVGGDVKGITDTKVIKIYQSICSHDGIKARQIARETGVDKSDINRLLYGAPFIRELCYRDSKYAWHGMIRQDRPHRGLGDFCGYYSRVDEFLALSEESWFTELVKGCKNIGRNLNDTRGLFHSFRDARETMIQLFSDLDGMVDGLEYDDWEICFELRIKRARTIRIYADVLVITEDKVFSLEFKMKNQIEAEEERQAVKYARYLDIIFGSDYEVIPALVLTKATDLYQWAPLPDTTADLPVCSGDMLFNIFDEYIGFLK